MIVDPRPANGLLRDRAATLFAFFFPVIMTWLYFVALPQENQDPNPLVRIVYTLGKFIQFSFPSCFRFLFEPERLDLPRPSRRGLAWGIGFGLLVGAAMILLYTFWLRNNPLMSETPGKLLNRLHQFNLDSPAGFLGVAIFYCLVHSLGEEYYWRWFVLGQLRREFAPGWAIVLSAIGFTLHHTVLLNVYFPGRFWIATLPLSIGIAVGGAFWAWLYQRCDSIYAPWLSHLLVDAAIMVVGYTMLFR